MGIFLNIFDLAKEDMALLHSLERLLLAEWQLLFLYEATVIKKPAKSAWAVRLKSQMGPTSLFVSANNVDYFIKI